MIGIDEVGRGAWAGPLLVVAARQSSTLIPELTDSKLLSRSRRRQLLSMIEGLCEFGEGWVSASEIDKIGLSKSLTLAASRALDEINASDNEPIMLDGKHNYLPDRFTSVKTMIHADRDVLIVSAASIKAKVVRDNVMIEFARSYVNYGFETHVGYGTAAHSRALQKYGPQMGLHRFCFKPIKKLC